MKSSVKTMFVVLAIVMSFAFVQYGWAHVESIEGPNTVGGTVAYTGGDTLAIACGYTSDPPLGFSCPLIVTGMGPAGWWSVNGVDFPAKGSEVIIDIYKITTDVGDIKYVAGEVVDNGKGESIVLRILDDDVLVPAWPMMEPLAEEEISTASDGTCACCPDCPNCTCPDCTDCQKTRQRKRGQTTILSLTNETGDLNCRCICLDDLQDCHCACGDGPTSNDD
jgi:hypothetical protein